MTLRFSVIKALVWYVMFFLALFVPGLLLSYLVGWSMWPSRWEWSSLALLALVWTGLAWWHDSRHRWQSSRGFDSR
jgi:hypothetical protein